MTYKKLDRWQEHSQTAKKISFSIIHNMYDVIPLMLQIFSSSGTILAYSRYHHTVDITFDTTNDFV